MNFLTSTVTIFLVGTILSSAVEALSLPYPGNVQTMCAATTCLKGTVCRVVMDSTSSNAQAACLPCVPEGVDDVCNAQRYIYAVLVGNVKRYGRLMPKYCVPNVPNASSGCPEGSVCTSQNAETGHCCLEPYSLDGPVTNGDAKCDVSGRCRRKCRKGYSCQPKIRACGRLAYKCQPNQFQCPPVPLPPFPDFCLSAKPGRFCETDENCEGDQKCCETLCGGRDCLSP